MSYRVKRIDPYWMKNPILPIVAVAGVLVALVAVQRAMFPVAIGGAVVGGVAVFLSTKPAVSAVLATLGLLGGLTTFLIVPNSQNAAMTVPLRLLSTVLFTLFYTVLMDGVVLLIAVLYNLFSGVIGLGGLSLDLEDEGESEA
ncbi:MAG: hypothetical protein A2V88_04545 [Elusimicrobia bacterium RBG_16_66_12]|nr:MAG: hypothetical protein A2V88_04545 [Elusimicrobia bacterium RBG_16_66_12]